jgi:hypothetical protein
MNQVALFIVLLVVVVILALVTYYYRRKVGGMIAGIIRGGTRSHSRSGVVLSKSTSLPRNLPTPKAEVKEPAEQVIIHITGPPGSGKTTMGTLLESDYLDIDVIDLDEHVAPIWDTIDAMEDKNVDGDKVGRKFAELCEKKFADLLVNSSRHTVITGVAGYIVNSNKYSPKWPNVVAAILKKRKKMPKKRRANLPVKIRVDKYCLKIPINRLMKQLVRRDYQDVLCSDAKSVNEIIRGQRIIRPLERGMEQYKAGLLEDWAKSAGYIVGDTEKVEAAIRATLDVITNVI